MKKKRTKLIKPVAVGFAVVYLAIMLLSTYLVKVQFQNDFDNTLKETLSNFQRTIYEKEGESAGTWDDAEKRIWYQSVANAYLLHDKEFIKLSLAVYDETGALLAKSENTIGASKNSMDELLSQEDKKTLAKYVGENAKLRNESKPEKYEILAEKGSGDTPFEIVVWELTWKKKEELKEGESYTGVYSTSPYTDYFGNVYYPEDDDALLTWYTTDRKQIWSCAIDGKIPPDSIAEGFSVDLEFPNIYYMGYKNWEEWDKSIFLHDFPEQTDLSEWSYAGAAEESSSWLRTSSVVRLGSEPESAFNRYIEAHMESYPWLAAFDYMKYLYAAGFVLILACMIKIIYSANRLYDQQEALEETRRDFINAIAHELKTPLGIIRNFAENLLEHTMEEKRDYYLTQIVGQAEEMDRLAGEMILVSRMDSENLVLQRETVSFDELIWEQLNRLKPVIEEKKLEVELQKEQDFRVEGDKDYLAKAVWNLLSNAAAYNVPEGRILITLKEKSCAIENTGFPLSEEQLKRSFELFYSGNKSRSTKDGKHMGMGLYLAEKIFSRHGLSIALENTKIGVKATISADNK